MTVAGHEVGLSGAAIATLALALSAATYFRGVLIELGAVCDTERALAPEIVATALGNCVLIMLMASGTVTYVGVPDAVDRVIRTVEANGATLTVSLVTFGWVMLWFAAVAALLQRLVAAVLSRYRRGSRLRIRAVLRRGAGKSNAPNALAAMPPRVRDEARPVGKPAGAPAETPSEVDMPLKAA